MYAKLTASVYLPNGISPTFLSLVGLKQGCNLSPLLFNLFINDFEDSINPLLCEAPLLHNIRINCLLYADDLVLISESKEGLQYSLNKLFDYSKKWHLNVNVKKTKSLKLTSRAKQN